MIKQDEVEWCPIHGYPEPCAKCYGMTKERWDEVYRSLAEAVSNDKAGRDKGLVRVAI